MCFLFLIILYGFVLLPNLVLAFLLMLLDQDLWQLTHPLDLA